MIDQLFEFSLFVACVIALFIGAGLFVGALALLCELYLSLLEFLNKRARARRRRRMGIYPQPKRRSRS